jgi:hypothetical protein
MSNIVTSANGEDEDGPSSCSTKTAQSVTQVCLFYQQTDNSCEIQHNTLKGVLFLLIEGISFFFTFFGAPVNTVCGCLCSLLVQFSSSCLHQHWSHVVAPLLVLALLSCHLPHHSPCYIDWNRCLVLTMFQ